MTSIDTWFATLQQARAAPSHSDRQRRECHELRDVCVTVQSADAESLLGLVRSLGWYYPSDAELRSIILGEHEEHVYTFRHLVSEQIPRVVALLRGDPHSRRAVLQFTEYAREPADAEHVPVLLSAFFRLEGGTLSMTVHARSVDLLLGFPANVYQMAVLLRTVAERLQCEPQGITVFMNSAHLFREYDEYLDLLFRQKP